MRNIILLLILSIILNCGLLFGEPGPMVIQFKYDIKSGQDIPLYHFKDHSYQLDSSSEIFKDISGIEITPVKKLIPKIEIFQFNEEKKLGLDLKKVDKLLNLQFIYLHYPLKKYFPGVRKLNFSFNKNDFDYNFELKNFDFKNLILMPQDRGINNFVIKNQDNIVISYITELKNRFKINLLQTNYLGLAKINVFANNKITPLKNAKLNIVNTFNEILYELMVDENGIAYNKKDKDIKLFDNFNDKPYFIEVFNQGQVINESTMFITANRHLYENEIFIYTDQAPLKEQIGKKFDLTGRLVFKDERTDELKALKNYNIKLYDANVGLVDIYSKNFEQKLIAVARTDENGKFEFKDILNKEGKFEKTLDIVLMMELENDVSKMINSYLGTDVTYMVKIFIQENIWPYKNKFNAKDIIIDISNIDYDKLMIFEEVNKAYLNYMNNITFDKPKLNIVFPAFPVKGMGLKNFEFDKLTNSIKISGSAGKNIIKYGEASRYLILY